MFLDEYWKHSALNFGQALHGARHLFSHPDFDCVARRGSLRHHFLSAGLRLKRLVNDLFFALIPPHWHHSREELAFMTRFPTRHWFDAGYAAWSFTEDVGRKTDLTGVDRRWDSRCRD